MADLKKWCVALMLVTLNAGALGAVLELPPQSTADGGIKVTVAPVDLDPSSTVWRFKVVLDSHSQELRDDLMTTVVLIDDRAESRRAVEWDGAGPGGHHREGVLKFTAPNPVPTMIELRMIRAGESVPRTFKWTLPK